MSYQLQLVMGTEKIDFIDDSGGVYFLVDGTFSAPPPAPVDIKAKPTFAHGSRLMKRVYGNRLVRFECEVQGDTVNDTVDSISAIYRLLGRASSDKSISGGLYSRGTTYDDANEVGENGLILRVKLKDTVNEDRLTFRVISGSLNVSEVYSAYGFGSEAPGSKKIVRGVTVELECEPFALGAPSSLSAQGTTIEGPPQATSSYDRSQPMYVKVSSSEVKGDVPGVTKINVKEDGASPLGHNGIILARESDRGVLSVPSYPIYTSGGGANDLWVFGGKDNTSIKEYRVEIDGASPDTFKWSDDGGATWEATGVSVTTTEYQLASNDVYIQFESTTGHAVGDRWDFKNDQRYIPINSTNSSPDLSNHLGTHVGSFRVNVPEGYSGRYGVILYMSDSASVGGTELRMNVIGRGLDSSFGPVEWSLYKTPWVVTEATNVAYLGVLDLTPNTIPVSLYPGANVIVGAEIQARRTTPADPSDIDLIYALLVPMESSDSHITWSVDNLIVGITVPNIVMCNYDKDRPIIGLRPNTALDNEVFMPIRSHYLGNPITVEPNIDQEICVYPVFGTANSPTSLAPSHAYVTLSVLEYRPRYLMVG